MGMQGAVGGKERLYIVFVFCREGGKPARGGNQTLLQRRPCCREVLYDSKRFEIVEMIGRHTHTHTQTHTHAFVAVFTEPVCTVGESSDGGLEGTALRVGRVGAGEDSKPGGGPQLFSPQSAEPEAARATQPQLRRPHMPQF